MKILGVTGSFGTGKTFVASLFRRLGARVIDADVIAHSVIGKGSPSYRRIVKVFGRGILLADGRINRKKLGRIVFSDSRLIKTLNAITHPAVIKIIKERINKYKDDAVIIIDAPLLVEAKLSGAVDALIVVKCSREKQIERCRKKFGIEKEEILKRIRKQIPIRRKIKMADYLIDNSGRRSETAKQVKKVWKEAAWK